jgi:hypothetical protein
MIPSSLRIQFLARISQLNTAKELETLMRREAMVLLVTNINGMSMRQKRIYSELIPLL